jgi:hypothetical protein
VRTINFHVTRPDGGAQQEKQENENKIEVVSGFD